MARLTHKSLWTRVTHPAPTAPPAWDKEAKEAKAAEKTIEHRLTEVRVEAQKHIKEEDAHVAFEDANALVSSRHEAEIEAETKHADDLEAKASAEVEKLQQESSQANSAKEEAESDAKLIEDKSTQEQKTLRIKLDKVLLLKKHYVKQAQDAAADGARQTVALEEKLSELTANLTSAQERAKNDTIALSASGDGHKDAQSAVEDLKKKAEKSRSELEAAEEDANNTRSADEENITELKQEVTAQRTRAQELARAIGDMNSSLAHTHAAAHAEAVDADVVITGLRADLKRNVIFATRANASLSAGRKILKAETSQFDSQREDLDKRIHAAKDATKYFVANATQLTKDIDATDERLISLNNEAQGKQAAQEQAKNLASQVGSLKIATENASITVAALNSISAERAQLIKGLSHLEEAEVSLKAHELQSLQDLNNTKDMLAKAEADTTKRSDARTLAEQKAAHAVADHKIAYDRAMEANRHADELMTNQVAEQYAAKRALEDIQRTNVTIANSQKVLSEATAKVLNASTGLQKALQEGNSISEQTTAIALRSASAQRIKEELVVGQRNLEHELLTMKQRLADAVRVAGEGAALRASVSGAEGELKSLRSKVSDLEAQLEQASGAVQAARKQLSIAKQEESDGNREADKQLTSARGQLSANKAILGKLGDTLAKETRALKDSEAVRTELTTREGMLATRVADTANAQQSMEALQHAEHNAAELSAAKVHADAELDAVKQSTEQAKQQLHDTSAKASAAEFAMQSVAEDESAIRSQLQPLADAKRDDDIHMLALAKQLEALKAKQRAAASPMLLGTAKFDGDDFDDNLFDDSW